MEYLPEEESELKKLPREFLGNVLYSVIGDRFYQWVKVQIEKRNEIRKEKQAMQIELDPQI